MKKKIVGVLVLCMVAVACTFGLFACNVSDTAENEGEIKSIYNTYVAYAESNGENPLSYEEWLASIKGKEYIIVTKVLDGYDEIVEYNIFENK